MMEETQEIALETESLLDLVWAKVQGWIAGFAEMIPNLAVALIVVLLAALAGRVVAKVVERALRRAGTNDQVVSLLAVLARLGIVGFGVFTALGILQLERTVTSLLAGIGVVGLALGFAFQDIASNFMSGIIMALREPFQLGDLVETHDTLGHVERVTLRATVIRNFWGQLVVIPNKDVLQNPIVNYSQTGKRRVEVPVGVSYADDLPTAAQVAREALETLPDRDDREPVDVYWSGFGASSIDLSARFWIDLANEETDFLTARSNGVEAIKRAFDEAGITIPFPIRTLALAEHEGVLLSSALGADERGQEPPADGD